MNTFKHADGRRVSTGFSLHNQRTVITILTDTADAAAAISAVHPALTASDGGQIRPRIGTDTSISQEHEKPSKIQKKKDAYLSAKNNTQGGITMSEAVNGKKGVEGKEYDQGRIGRYYYDGNANAFYEGIKEGTLPAVSKTGAELLPNGIISMTPNAVRYYTNGKMFPGVNQLVAQKFAHEMGFQPDQNGNINVVTYRQAGEKNLMKGQKHFPLASYDKEKNQVNYYNLYPESALIDKTKVEVKSPYDTKKIHREHREIQIEAMDENISIAEYFGKYEAATQLGATFVTTKAAIKSVQEKAEKEIAPHIKTGLTGKIYAMSAEMSNVSKDEMQKVFQSMKPKAREMTMQQDQSISMN